MTETVVAESVRKVVVIALRIAAIAVRMAEALIGILAAQASTPTLGPAPRLRA